MKSVLLRTLCGRASTPTDDVCICLRHCTSVTKSDVFTHRGPHHTCNMFTAPRITASQQSACIVSRPLAARAARAPSTTCSNLTIRGSANAHYVGPEGIETLTKFWYHNNKWPRKEPGRRFFKSLYIVASWPGRAARVELQKLCARMRVLHRRRTRHHSHSFGFKNTGVKNTTGSFTSSTFTRIAVINPRSQRSYSSQRPAPVAGLPPRSHRDRPPRRDHRRRPPARRPPCRLWPDSNPLFASRAATRLE